MTRFIEKDDTPCPFRLGRMGYTQTTEFRTPKPGELFILPTDSYPLEDYEPQVVGACGEFTTDEKRHIVVAISESTSQEIESWGGLFIFLASEEAMQELFDAEVKYDEPDPCD